MDGTVHNLCYHIVLGTADRRPMIPPGLRKDLYGLFEELVRGSGGIVVGVGGIPNHVHLFVRLPPSVVVSELVRVLKAESTRWARKTPGRDLEWGEGYGAFSVGQAQAPEVLRLLHHQERHHLRRSYAYELLALINGGGAAHIAERVQILN